MTTMTMRCFVCRRELAEVLPEEGVFRGQPYDGTAWMTTGNYGSTVYDPISEHQHLEAYICDECLREREELVVTVRPKPIRQEWEHHPGIHDKPESYAPFSEAFALLRKLEAQRSCPVCGGEGRTHRPSCRLAELLRFADAIWGKRPCSHCKEETADRCWSCGTALCESHRDADGNARCYHCRGESGRAEEKA